MITFPTKQQNTCGYIGKITKKFKTCPECGTPWYVKNNIGCREKASFTHAIGGRSVYIHLNKRGSTFLNESAFR